MGKAFLCHSSRDKEFVRVTARHLGRAKVVYDEMTFEPGQDFRDQILKGLEEAGFFVFFISRASLNSIWCRFEADEAQFRRMSEKMGGHLAIIIDPRVSFEEIPRWMKRTKAIIQTSPKQATRDIQHALFSILPPTSAHAFIGRQTLQQEFVDRLSSIASPHPNVFIATGLEQIGRKSYLGRVCRDNLGLDLGPTFQIDVTRGLEDLYLWVLEETSDLGTRADMAHQLEVFEKLTQDDQAKEIVARLHVMGENRCIPCLVDQGGMLEDTGDYKPEYIQIIQGYAVPGEDTYLALVHRRVPRIRELPISVIPYVMHQRVPPLERQESRLLLQQLFRKEGLRSDPNAIDELAEHVDGYPPSAYYTASVAKDYGVSALCANKTLLGEFKSRTFTRFITDLKLPDNEWLVLRYLASEQIIPLSVIAVALDFTLEDTALHLRNLIDHSLVLVPKQA